MRQQLPRNGCHCPFSTTVVINHPKNPQRHASSGTTEEVNTYKINKFMYQKKPNARNM
jgi:hypothetical protein